MDQIKPLKQVQKTGIYTILRNFIVNASEIIELLIIVGFYIIIFFNKSVLYEFNKKEIITYILIGNLIGALSGYFLRYLIIHKRRIRETNELIIKPIKYFQALISKNAAKSILPFLLVIIANLLLLKVVVGNIPSAPDIEYLIVIALMLVLAFIFEFLLVYLSDFFIFWSFESSREYNIISRVKRLLAGAYFPLSFLPLSIFNFSLFFPFAYSFFMPTQLYLKKIGLSEGIKGLYIQLLWITMIYMAIYFLRQQKLKKYHQNKPS